MLNEINSIIKNYSKNIINHIYSIILRANYEYRNMKTLKKIDNFDINQMNNFSVSYKNNKFIIIINKNILLFSCRQMDKIVEEIYEYFKKFYPINYDYKQIDPIYFSLFFYDLIDKIIDVKIDTINIKDIRLLRKNGKSVSMEDSERYKALKNKDYKMYSPFASNLLTDTDRDRLYKIFNSVKEKGYGYNNQYAIFYNDEPFLRDGQHRVSALKYLYGDINVKIIRFYLRNNYFYK